MRVCVLADGYSDDIEPGAFLQGHDWQLFRMTAPIADRIRDLAQSAMFDVFLNLCKGYRLERTGPESAAYLGIEVVQTLEEIDAPFTGAGTRSWEPGIERQRAAARETGISFVRGAQVESVEQALLTAKNLRYPLMVRRPQGVAGDRVPDDAVVETVDQLKVEVAGMVSTFHAARVEQFVPGHEYAVLVVDDPEAPQQPLVYPPAELVFVPGWDHRQFDTASESDKVADLIEVTQPETETALKTLARRFYLGLDLTGYALVTVRGGADELVLLGIETNPAIMSPGRQLAPADHMIHVDPGGYPLFIDRILAAALARVESGRAISRSV